MNPKMHNWNDASHLEEYYDEQDVASNYERMFKNHCKVLKVNIEGTVFGQSFSVSKDERLRIINVRVGNLFLTPQAFVKTDGWGMWMSMGVDYKIISETTRHSLLLVDVLSVSIDRNKHETHQVYKGIRKTDGYVDSHCIHVTKEFIQDKIDQDVADMVTAKLKGESDRKHSDIIW